MIVRLDKFLADAGIGTRSEVKKYIKAKQVTVNKEPAKGPEQKICPENDCICCGGKEIRNISIFYYMFHKPAGYVTARHDAVEQTVMDFFPDFVKKKGTLVGRLDKDTEGLLLVTNDGELNHRLTSPAYHLEKTYYARLNAPVSPDAVEQFANGIDIGDDKPTLPANLTIFPVEETQTESIYSAKLTICEGRFHQVKRMFHAIGSEVIYLKRVSMGGVTLGNLPRGEYRELTEKEVMELKQAVSCKREKKEVKKYEI